MNPSDPAVDIRTEPLTAPRWRDLVRTRGVLVVLLVELIVASMVVYGLWQLRRQTLDSQLRTLASLAAAMAAQANSTLDVANAVLGATRGELRDGFIQPGSDAAHDVLRARAAALPQFRALVIVDAQGNRLATSRDEAGPALAVAERDFFIAARDRTGPALFVGTPFVSRVDGKASLGVSMDWRDRHDTFKGVVMLVADAGFLDGDFEHVAPSPDTTMAIYRADHGLVSGGPGDGAARVLPATVVGTLWSDASPELPRRIDFPDGRERLVAAHRLQRFPLMVVLTRDAQAVLEEWNDQAWLLGSFVASALLVTFLLALRNSREQHLLQASQKALAEEQERAVRAFQAAQEGNWEWNPLTRQTFLSPRMKELLGLSDADGPVPADELLARSTVHADDVGAVHRAFVEHLADRSPHVDVSFRVLAAADGRWHHVRARGQVWRDAQGRPLRVSGSASDVTAELESQRHAQQLEEQLQRSRKLEALGTLAGGIAHDFNNILAAVIGYGELARHAAADGSGQARQLDHVLQAGLRGKALVERILSFSRTGQRPHTALLLQPVIDEVLQLLSASLPAGVHLQTRLHAPEAAVSGDATQVFEAAMNLCTNALQAMRATGQDGTLEVELTVVELAQPMALFEKSLCAGRYARLVVGDTGPGIEPPVMARLFEPFFTTKPAGVGTGLGLAVVHGVMADLGGAIDVQSSPGQGARFTLYFPCVDAAEVRGPVADDLPARGAGQTVLVVDDEAALVELAEELLAELGYEPVGFRSSAQALAAFTENPDRFDLILTDEVMPEMTGTELSRALHALRPLVPIVMASGYGGPQLQARATEAGVTVLVKKPLVRAEVAAALAQALRADGARQMG